MTTVKTDPVRVAGRFLVGRPLDGVRRSNSTFLHRSSNGGSAWMRLAGWQRSAWRLGVPAAAIAAENVYVYAPAATEAGGAVLAAVAAHQGYRRARQAWRMRRFRKVYIRPTLGALAGALGDAPVRLHVDPSLGTLVARLVKPMSPVEKWFRTRYGQHVEPVLRYLPERAMRAWWYAQTKARPVTRHLEAFRRPVDESAGPRIELTAGVPFLTAEQREYVAAVVKAKIPVAELVESWDQVGQRVTVTWVVRRQPPASCGYADLDARMGNLKEDEFFLGLGVGGKPVIVSLSDDSPHIAESAASGAGKSVLARLVAMQVLARGGRVVVLDLKGSHRALLGLSGVEYCTRPEQMQEAMVRVATIAERRNSEAFCQPEDWDPGPRVLVIAEELNATFGRIRAWWDGAREKGQPKIPPFVRAFREVMFMGRSAKVNILAIAQMLTANTVGGPEARENFSIRCLSRYTKNNWQMLVPESPMPRASRTQGRWQVVVGGVATETQVAYLSAAETRLFVAKHRGVSDVSTPADSPLVGADQEMSQRLRQEADPMAVLITLRDAVEKGALPWKYHAARQRLQRARKAGRGVPETQGRDGTTDLYRLGDLITWAESEMVS